MSGGQIDTVMLENRRFPPPAEFASKGRNSPYIGQTLVGRVMATFYGGRAVHLDREAEQRV